ncbi:UNVERIFIED_CONTAM: putative serine/threonine-protein kinase [Sesamum latifolium]|uniref:non-specific serine/threonine protein kinase n=1 Tax=Sesamum latifolium TaxID=2727402 RepID=A0AAW2VTX3_9LAMI
MSDGKLTDELSKRTSISACACGLSLESASVQLLSSFSSSSLFGSPQEEKRRLHSRYLTRIPSSQMCPGKSRKSGSTPLEPQRPIPSCCSASGTHPIPEPDLNEDKRIHIEIGKGHRIAHPERVGPGSGSGHGSGEARPGGEPAAVIAGPEVSHLGWGHWYTLRELEESTNSFADENVIGEGGYGIVYYGVLGDDTKVAVKNLLNNRGQAEREFKVEVEAIGRVRHKNLVRLLGYCVEGAHRMLVYEYVDNGNLEQWLHGDVGPCSPLTWDIRMNIILGTAKGLTYLHEGLEPKVVHRDIKSSNILLDRQWNSKVSDFGLAKLIGSERSYITTRVMGTFGYVAPEYASTGMLNERSDVYSFGILIMEIITGRNPVDYSRPRGSMYTVVNLVDWLKTMVSNRNAEGVLDPKLPEKPSSRALKRTLLVALRCVDPNAQKRPKMGHVVHMLEADDFPFRDDRRGGREHGRPHHDGTKERVAQKHITEPGDSSGNEGSTKTDRFLLRKQEADKKQ